MGCPGYRFIIHMIAVWHGPARSRTAIFEVHAAGHTHHHDGVHATAHESRLCGAEQRGCGLPAIVQLYRIRIFPVIVVVYHARCANVVGRRKIQTVRPAARSHSRLGPPVGRTRAYPDRSSSGIASSSCQTDRQHQREIPEHIQPREYLPVFRAPRDNPHNVVIKSGADIRECVAEPLGFHLRKHGPDSKMRTVSFVTLCRSRIISYKFGANIGRRHFLSPSQNTCLCKGWLAPMDIFLASLPKRAHALD